MRFPSLLLAPLASLAAGLPAAATTRPAAPNILMIAVDDLNNWITPLRGLAKTPHIDRLAREGMLFRNAHCVTPACNPSRVALMTGLRPETTGVFQNEDNFRRIRPANASVITLAQYVRGLGYDAIAAGKIFHQPRGQAAEPRELSDPVSWTDQWAGPTGTGGGARYLNAEGFPLWHDGDPRLLRAGHGYAAKGLYWGPIDEAKEQTGDWLTARFCADYLAKPHARPFFLACGIFRPHSPQLAPREFFDLYPLDSLPMPEMPADDMDDVPEAWRTNWSTPVTRLMKEKGEWKKAVQAYLASASFADACIGHLLDALRASPHAANTIVILWGDHGWHHGTKDRIEKFSLWFEATNAPLIIKAPGFAPGESHRAVSLLDLYPTVAGLLGRPVPSHLEGTSLLPLLRDPAAPRTAPAVVTYPKDSHGVHWEHWNYIRYKDGAEELYDHRSDPLEYTNLIGRPGTESVVEQLAAALSGS